MYISSNYSLHLLKLSLTDMKAKIFLREENNFPQWCRTMLMEIFLFVFSFSGDFPTPVAVFNNSSLSVFLAVCLLKGQ